ncbi:MAG: hypothetical protein IT371_22660 [Deltaproteobacteria bacterium]|nr:hypothetical protein [Deltaproteobacteria bacterium]
MCRGALLSMVLLALGAGCGTSDGTSRCLGGDPACTEPTTPPSITEPPTGPAPARAVLQTVVSQVQLPRSASEHARDLDGDGLPDNQLGRILGALSAVMPQLDVQGLLDGDIRAGRMLVLHEVVAPGLSDGTRGELRTYVGRPVEGVGPQHIFDGASTLQPLPSIDGRTSLRLEVQGGRLSAGPGDMVVPFVHLNPVPGGAPVLLPLKRVTVEADLGPGVLTGGRMTGAIPVQQMVDRVLPVLAKTVNDTYHMGGLEEQVRTGIRKAFDPNGDGRVTVEEFANSPAVLLTLRNPDVDLDGNGVKDALSFGLSFKAVPCKIDAGR